MEDQHSEHAQQSEPDDPARVGEDDLDALVSTESADALSLRPQARSLSDMRPSEVVRLLNSTPLGVVTSERQLYRFRERAGLRITGGKRVDLIRLAAWLATEHYRIPHAPQLADLTKATCGTSTPRHSPQTGAVVTAFEVQDLLVRQEFRCALTGAELEPTNAAMDHIQAVSRGGTHTIDNAQILRKEVNRAKGTLTNEEFIKLCRAVVQHVDRVKSQPKSPSNKDSHDRHIHADRNLAHRPSAAV